MRTAVGRSIFPADGIDRAQKSRRETTRPQLAAHRESQGKTRRVESAGLSLIAGESWDRPRSARGYSGGIKIPSSASHEPKSGAYAQFEALRVEYRTRQFRWNFAPAPSIRRCPQCWASSVSETRWRRPPSARASTETTPSFANVLLARAERRFQKWHQIDLAGNSVSMPGQKPWQEAA